MVQRDDPLLEIGRGFSKHKIKIERRDRYSVLCRSCVPDENGLEPAFVQSARNRFQNRFGINETALGRLRLAQHFICLVRA